MMQDTLSALFSSAVAEVRVDPDLAQSAMAGARRRRRRTPRTRSITVMRGASTARSWTRFSIRSRHGSGLYDES